MNLFEISNLVKIIFILFLKDKMEVVKDKLMEVQEFYNWTLSFSGKLQKCNIRF